MLWLAFVQLNESILISFRQPCPEDRTPFFHRPMIDLPDWALGDPYDDDVLMNDLHHLDQ